MFNPNNYMIINGQRIDLTEELVKEIAAAYNTAGVKLSEIPAGETFKIEGREFVALEQYPEATAVILQDVLPEEMTFGSCNRYDGSNPDKACCEFAEELFATIGRENVIPHSVDLTADDGLKDYGRVDRAVSLLTAPEYRQYVEILDKFKPDAWWWLATPHSTVAHENDQWVKCVAPSGYVNRDYYLSDDNGVRPFCILKSDIFVSK